MNELIKITESNGKAVVSCRELYEQLGFNMTHWAKWYKKNILDNQFAEEGADYEVLALSAKTPSGLGGRPVQDFAVTIDFAKKISMMARTDKGEAIREYFIACEKKALQPKELSRIEILQLAMESEQARIVAEEKVAKLEIERKLLAPVVEHANQVLNTENAFPISFIAKELGTSAIQLNKLLANLKVQFKRDGVWQLYADYHDKGYTKLHTDVIGDHTIHTMFWTEKGRMFIHRLINETKRGKEQLLQISSFTNAQA